MSSQCCPPMMALLVATSLSLLALAQPGFVPLAQKRFTYPDGIPYKVDTDVGQPRGNQKGYNICNSTTEGPESLCQTALFNSLDDFCFWAPAEPGHTVGEIEGEMIAWCTKPGHGTRVLPPGTLQGVQFMKTPDYVQVTGFMDQTRINMVKGDAGGEMDPHGADLRGNPMGGIMFTQSFNGSWVQVEEWHNFMGNDYFCLKACDPAGRDDARFCEHIYDTVGCGANAPSNAQRDVFESCAGENQDFPPSPRVPTSSSCSQFKSADIYGGCTAVPVAQITGLPVGVTNDPSRPLRVTQSASGTCATSTPTPKPGGSATNSGTGTSAPTQTSSSTKKSAALSGVMVIIMFSIVTLLT